MWIYLLKFSACLLALLLFYKLVLEKVHIHHFKRYYLLAAFIIALGIPLITFTHYVTVDAQPLSYQSIINPNFHQQLVSPEETNVVPLILWSIYGLGVAIFGIKFLLNLNAIINSIRKNTKQRSGKFLHVLLHEKIVPHTFFNYLFFNLNNYKTNKIPQEVFWHEETHANQKHSADILLIELFQILLWFHPLIYWAKHLVKLNHEFLADQAVLKKGAVIPAYQNLVLAFSSIALTPPLANAIHYSSIKKRIVIMKTQTSQKAIWLKSLLLLPLMALLLYSFSTKEILEIKKVENETILSDHLKEKRTFHEIFYGSKIQNITELEIVISINKYGQLLINDNVVKIEDLKSHLLNYNQDLNKEQRSKLLRAIIRIDKETSDNIVNKVESILMDYGVATIDINEYKKLQDQEGASKAEIKEFNTLAKKYNEQPVNERIVKAKDLERLEFIYNRMSDAQKKNAEPFPNFPPPPPAPAPRVMKNSKLPPPPPIPPTATKVEREKYERAVKAYKKGNPGIIKTQKTSDNEIIEVIEIVEDQEPLTPAPKVMKNSKLPPPPPIPPTATKVEREKYERAVKAYKKGNPGIIKIKKISDDEIIEVVEIVEDQESIPPPPPSPTVHFKELHQKGAKFYQDDNAISYDRALKILKDNKNLNIEIKETGGEPPTVKLSTKPIKTKN